MLLACALTILATPSRAALTVWVEFDAAWATELNDAAIAAGVPTFTAGEQTVIETGIVAELARVYADYSITFTPSPVDIGGTRHWVDMGATIASPSTLGSAPSIFGLGFTHDEQDTFFPLFAPFKADVYAANFGFVIEPGDSRATQISELTIALAGTAAHELGHSLGLLHHHAYGNDGIHPGTYGATGGAQNTAIMGTGSTGISEAGRESLRDLGKWERALLDISGGSVFTRDAGTGASVVGTPVVTEDEAGDAGSTAGSSQALTPQTGETSDMLMGFVTGSLTSPADADWYSMTLSGPGTLTLDLWSASAYGTSFDTLLTLIGPDGVSPFITNDDGAYTPTTYGIGKAPPSDGSSQSFIPNFAIVTPGTYYFAVSAIAGGDPGDDYSLIVGFESLAIPEPSAAVLGFVGTIGLWLRRRRHTA